MKKKTKIEVQPPTELMEMPEMFDEDDMLDRMTVFDMQQQQEDDIRKSFIDLPNLNHSMSFCGKQDNLLMPPEMCDKTNRYSFIKHREDNSDNQS